MHEELLDVMISSKLARVAGGHHGNGFNGSKLIVLQDVYPNSDVHRALPEICQTLVKSGGIRLIAFEGACGAIELPPHVETREQVLALYSGLSMAAINTVLLRPAHVRMVGVDELARQKACRGAQRHLVENERVLYRAFVPIIDRLRQAQVLYPPELADLRRVTLDIYGERQNLTQQVSAVKRAAAALRVDLRQLSSFTAFDELLAQERCIDFEVAAQQRSQLVRRWGEVLGEATESDPLGNVDANRCAALLRAWMRLNEIADPELMRAIELRGVGGVVSECHDAMLTWSTKLAQDIRTGHTESADGQGTLLGQMLELIRALDMNVEEYDMIERYARYLDGASRGLNHHALLQEMRQWAELLVDAEGSREVRALFELEAQLDLTWRALGMHLTPSQAEAVMLHADTLDRNVEQLDGLCALIPTASANSTIVDRERLRRGIEAAATFYELSLARGQCMVANTLDAMRQDRTDRAILVAGGFHTRMIEKRLEDESECSWTVISAQLRMPDDAPASDPPNRSSS
jgi:hypothetical protein